MSNLTPSASWDDVVQLQGTMSGVPSTWNTPNQALLNRIEWLKNYAVIKDGNGNTSLGATPNTWHASARAFQLGATSIAGGLWSYSNTQINVSQGLYYDSTGYKYQTSGIAVCTLSMNSGALYFQQAPAGTAGSAPTFTNTFTFDVNGNFGLGVTPSAWDAGYRALDVNSGGGIVNYVGATSDFYAVNNAYFAGGVWKRKTSDYAMSYAQTAGTHAWYVAAAGSAGTTITWTQALKIDANARLKVNTNADPVSTTVRLVMKGDATYGAAIELVDNSGGGCYVTPVAGGGCSMSVFTGGVGAETYTAAFKFDATGFGYPTGAGGAVTQATSKSTGVTLNKPSGQITMNGAALAAGASVTFGLSNSAIGATDTITVNPTGSGAMAQNYSARAGIASAGTAYITVKNETAGSLSDAVVLNFVVTKGANA